MYYKPQVGGQDTVLAAYLGLRVYFFPAYPGGRCVHCGKEQNYGIEITPPIHPMAITYTTAFGVGLNTALLPQVGRDDGVIAPNQGLVIQNALRGKEWPHHGLIPSTGSCIPIYQPFLKLRCRLNRSGRGQKHVPSHGSTRSHRSAETNGSTRSVDPRNQCSIFGRDLCPGFTIACWVGFVVSGALSLRSRNPPAGWAGNL